MIQHTDKVHRSTVNKVDEETSVGRNDQMEGIGKYIAEPIQLGENSVDLQQGNVREQIVDMPKQENTYSFLEDKLKISQNESLNLQSETFLNVMPSMSEDFDKSTQIVTENSATNLSVPKDNNGLVNSGVESETSNHDCSEVGHESKEAVSKKKLTLPSNFQNSDVETGYLSTEEEDETEDGGSESDLEDNDDLDDDVVCSVFNKWKMRETNPQLPETVTVLKTTEDCLVYLVGTAHFSNESQDDVSKTIIATQPDIVMVELCRRRANILALDEKTILEESRNMNLEKVRDAIRQNGVVQGVMYLLLLSMSAHLTKELGMAPGGEFRRAFSEAKKVPGCLIHLGDRPIQITLQRVLASLSLWQKLRVAWYMLTSKEPISKEEVEKCKQRDLLEEMLAEMTGEFPALSTVFVKERDMYLAYSLRLAATPLQDPKSPNGMKPTVVVGVVGIGHVPGIVENWDKVSDADITPLLIVPEPSLAAKVFRHTLKISVLSLALWGCWRLLPSSFKSSLSLQKPLDWLNHMFTR
ncbi:traB domain-containing protein-like isoform X2 [Tachypleus tridentatus]